jgi:SdpC family antimicrobial peptide
MMRKQRILALPVALSLVLGAIGSVAHAGTGDEASEQTVGTGVTREDAKDVFRGLHFADGRAFDSLPELQAVYADAPPVADEAAARAFADAVIEELEIADPEFFDAYADELASGSPARVSAAVEGGDERLRSVLAERAPGTLAEVSPAACTFGVLVCGLTVVVAVNYGAAVNVAAGVNVWVALWGPKKTWSPFAAEGSDLQRQLVIGSVADYASSEH